MIPNEEGWCRKYSVHTTCLSLIKGLNQTSLGTIDAVGLMKLHSLRYAVITGTSVDVSLAPVLSHLPRNAVMMVDP